MLSPGLLDDLTVTVILWQPAAYVEADGQLTVSMSWAAERDTDQRQAERFPVHEVI
jgi:hypothetical protein